MGCVAYLPATLRSWTAIQGAVYLVYRLSVNTHRSSHVSDMAERRAQVYWTGSGIGRSKYSTLVESEQCLVMKYSSRSRYTRDAGVCRIVMSELS